MNLNPFTNQRPGFGFVADYDELWDWVEWLPEDFGWFCLGHNFDIVATILTMSHLSWEQGFNAGRVIAGFCDQRDEDDIQAGGPALTTQECLAYLNSHAVDSESVQLGPHPTD